MTAGLPFCRGIAGMVRRQRNETPDADAARVRSRRRRRRYALSRCSIARPTRGQHMIARRHRMTDA
jgi:hypothetical protein